MPLLAPGPRRVSPVPSLDCPCMPRPLRRRVLGGCASQILTASVAFADLRPARLPLVPPSPGGCLTTRQTSLHAADCRVARPPEEGFVSGLRRGDFAPFSIRRRSATRRLGPYRNRTFTGKHITACSGHTHSRMPLSGTHNPDNFMGPHQRHSGMTAFAYYEGCGDSPPTHRTIQTEFTPSLYESPRP